ncbi:kelch motif-containing protein, partial [Paenibacillus polymyxa]|nr:kelch motif-containing protein [Paenibacillus polymyxa]
MVEPLNNFKPPPLPNHSMSVYKNKLFVFGGVYNNEKVSNDLWSLDAVVNKWTQLPTSGSVPAPVNEHSSCI